MNRRGFLKGLAAAVPALLISGLVAQEAEAYGPRHARAAVRGTARRTARRTTRRVARRRMVMLPPVYTTTVVSGVTIYVVDGVQYAKEMDNGQVVYIEVQ